MARIIPSLCLCLITMFGKAAVAAEASSARIDAVGVPAGFAELTREHEILVDTYFGGRKIGEAMVLVRPGHVRFKAPSKVLASIPSVEEESDVLIDAISSDLPSNSGLACSQMQTQECGVLSPEVVGVILDEDHFRLDLFVNRKFLRLIRPQNHLYLAVPTAPLSLTSSAGLALSGSNESSPAYNFQNRTIIGFHNARLRTETSYASGLGLVVDTAVGEVDRPGARYSAGLFWAPGIDLTGRRRILGIGAATQFDTRTDRDSLVGTPVVLFLAQPARVDFVIDGRLVDSRAYEAGNNILDTSALPNGSYLLELRIHLANGSVREERRFFAKNAQIAPVGQPIYFGYVGVLANTRPGQVISLSNGLFYQFGAARRISNAFAFDLSVVGTSRKPLVEAGAWLITSLGRMRVAGLVSPSGDRGALLQIASGETGRLNVNFDLRRVWSHDGNPLIPLSTYVNSFDSVPLDQRQIGAGSFTQASGSIGYRFGAAYLAVIGSFRKDKGLPADYSIGPNLNWPFLNKNGLQVALQADAQLTRTTTAAYVGVRLFFTSRGYSLSSVAGRRDISNRDSSGPSNWRAVGDTTAHFSYGDESGTDLSLAAGVSREIDSTTAHAEALAYSRFGSVRGEFLHDFEGSHRTQYSLSVQTGAVLNRDDALLGGRNLAESGIVISLDGRGDSEFEVLVNGQSRGRVRAGRRLPILLDPYHRYSINLHPTDAASVWYDTAVREVTLYPGNVQHVRWHVERLTTVFGRAVTSGGTPVAHAIVTSRRGIGETDADGYFQIETTANEVLLFEKNNGERCRVSIERLGQNRDFAPVGKVICQ